RKHSRNRPLLRVGLPNTTHMMTVFSSVSAPSATSHTLSWIFEASSNRSRIILPLLCRPANASVLCSLHGMKSCRQLSVRVGSRLLIDMVCTSNHFAVSDMRNHLPISGAVLVRSWPSVLAVVTILASSQQDIAQLDSMPISADFPMP